MKNFSNHFEQKPKSTLQAFIEEEKASTSLEKPNIRILFKEDRKIPATPRWSQGIDVYTDDTDEAENADCLSFDSIEKPAKNRNRNRSINFRKQLMSRMMSSRKTTAFK